MSSFLRALLELVLPPRCAGCAMILVDGGECFCEPCQQSLVSLGRACPRCGEPGAADLCAACRRSPPPFASVAASLLYGGQLAVALQRFKYGGAGHLAHPLGRLLAPTLESALRARPSALVVPVPLHPRRLAERGYNQSALLATCAGTRPERRALRRIRPTAPQAGLDRAARRRNLRGAFRAHPLVRGHAVLLVDDVLTTGATARACSEALLEAGAAVVDVLVLARAGA